MTRNLGLSAKIEPSADKSSTRKMKRDLEKELEDVEQMEFQSDGSGSFKSRTSPSLGGSAPTGVGSNGGGGFDPGVGSGMAIQKASGGGAAASRGLAGLGKGAGVAATVGLGGVLAKKMYDAMSAASGRLSAANSIWDTAMQLFWKPFGDALGKHLLPLAKEALDMALHFNELYQEKGLAVAVGQISAEAAAELAKALDKGIRGGSKTGMPGQGIVDELKKDAGLTDHKSVGQKIVDGLMQGIEANTGLDLPLFDLGSKLAEWDEDIAEWEQGVIERLKESFTDLPSLDAPDIIGAIGWPDIDTPGIVGAVDWPSLSTGSVIGAVGWPSLSPGNIVGAISWPSISGPTVVTASTWPSVNAALMLGQADWPTIGSNNVLDSTFGSFSISKSDVLDLLFGDGGGGGGGGGSGNVRELSAGERARMESRGTQRVTVTDDAGGTTKSLDSGGTVNVKAEVDGKRLFEGVSKQEENLLRRL